MNWSASTRAIKSPCGASAIHSVIWYNFLYDRCPWCWGLPYYQFLQCQFWSPIFCPVAILLIKKTRSKTLGRSLWSVVPSTSSNDIWEVIDVSSLNHMCCCDIWLTRADSRSDTSMSSSRREVVRLSFMSSTSAILMSDCKASFIKINPINCHSSSLIIFLKVIMIFVIFYFTSFMIENINFAMELLMNLS